MKILIKLAFLLWDAEVVLDGVGPKSLWFLSKFRNLFLLAGNVVDVTLGDILNEVKRSSAFLGVRPRRIAKQGFSL